MAAQPQELTEAFATFSRLSAELQSSYQALQQEVVSLRAELEQARLMRELLERQKRLTVIGEMAAALAHQIRTPLSAALLYASQVATPGLSAVARARFADKTRVCLQDLERLVNDMLAFARGGGGVVEPFCLSALLERVLSCMEPRLREGGRLTIRTLAPELKLRGNTQALAGALLNLAGNAFEIGGSEVTVLIEARSPREGWAEIQVSDNGPGIPEDLRDRIFEPFFTTRQRGTGLGLAVVKSVVTAHGGEVCLEDKAGPGASFVIRLPIAAEAAVMPLAAPPEDQKKMAQAS